MVNTSTDKYQCGYYYRGSSSLADINGKMRGLRLKSLVLLFYQDAQIQYFLLGMLILVSGP